VLGHSPGASFFCPEVWRNEIIVVSLQVMYLLKVKGMKKLLSWGFAAALICGLNVFSSCINDNDDNPVSPGADETFSIVTLNVDGLPGYIDATPLGMGVLPLNVEGPGEKYTPVISQYLAEKYFDFIAVQEDFDFNAQLDSKLKEGYHLSDTWGGPLSLDAYLAGVEQPVSQETILAALEKGTFCIHSDGCRLYWKKDISGTRVDSVSWRTRFGDVVRPTHMNHANDEMLSKGFRRYEMKLKGGTELVLYNMHLEASDDETEATGEDAVDRRSRMVHYRDLRDHIMKHLDKRPIIVVGDMNSYYERDSVELQFINEINNSGRATIGDVWIELERGGKYPALEEGVVMQDKGSRGWSRKGQTLDKIFYVNPIDAVRKLKPTSVTIDSVGYVREDGWTPLGDHSPLSAVFGFVSL
jgi:hypothetical protein